MPRLRGAEQDEHRVVDRLTTLLGRRLRSYRDYVAQIAG